MGHVSTFPGDGSRWWLKQADGSGSSPVTAQDGPERAGSRCSDIARLLEGEPRQEGTCTLRLIRMRAESGMGNPPVVLSSA